MTAARAGLELCVDLRRPDQPDRPVRVGHDPETSDVVVVLDHDHAPQLAAVLAWHAGLTSDPRVVSADQRDTWIQVFVDLLAARALAAQALHLPISHVPVLGLRPVPVPSPAQHVRREEPTP